MAQKLTRAQTIARNRLDAQIAEIHRRRCAGWAINMMDIGKVFQAGYEAAHSGEDIETAVVNKAAELRQQGS